MSLPQRMTRHVQEYLALRRAFGFRLSIAGEQLESFARFADGTGRGKVLTIDLALRWAQSSSTGKQTTAARRLLILRPFARYLQTIEPLTEVPPNRILGPAQYRHIPHIYTHEEIRSLFDAAADLRPQGGLRARSFRTYLNLLLCTGMRPPEPLRLTRADVDVQARTLTVRQTKFSKSRILVLHSTAANALREYARARDRCVALPQSSAFFLCDDATAFTHKKALWAFHYLRRQLNWVQRPGYEPPRLYDIRHTFVCRRLLTWYRQGVDVHVALPALSTYLGHVKVTDTYWYVTGIPELMNTISARFERFVGCDQEDGHELE
jgi:integrase/recombinase XerD